MKRPSPTLGCIVVMERGATWPAGVLRELKDGSSVVVVAPALAERQSRLWKRIAARCSELSSAGVKLTTAVLVCAGPATRERIEARVDMARKLTALLPPGQHARLVLTTGRHTARATHRLLEVAAALIEGHDRASVPIQVVAASGPPAELPAPLSGPALAWAASGAASPVASTLMH